MKKMKNHQCFGRHFLWFRLLTTYSAMFIYLLFRYAFQKWPTWHIYTLHTILWYISVKSHTKCVSLCEFFSNACLGNIFLTYLVFLRILFSILRNQTIYFKRIIEKKKEFIFQLNSWNYSWMFKKKLGKDNVL